MEGNNNIFLPKTSAIYKTEFFHFEKYAIPGALAVALLFLVPWYLLGGRSLGGFDLGTTIIAAFVLGHIIESLKVYQWGHKVREVYAEFNAKVEGLINGKSTGPGPSILSSNEAKTILFSILAPAERTEFAWNLVRWQKMTVFAAIATLAAIQWVLIAGFAVLEHFAKNPFQSQFSLSILKDNSTVWKSVVGELIIALLFLVCSHFLYKYGRIRQDRNNNFYFQLMRKYIDTIIAKHAASV